MKVKVLMDLEVKAKSADNDVTHKLLAGWEMELGILPSKSKFGFIDVQFPDESVAFGLPLEAFEIISVQSLHEQNLMAEQQTENGFVCLEYVRALPKAAWHWKVAKVCDNCTEAQNWWNLEKRIARVYRVMNGKALLRFAK